MNTDTMGDALKRVEITQKLQILKILYNTVGGIVFKHSD